MGSLSLSVVPAFMRLISNIQKALQTFTKPQTHASSLFKIFTPNGKTSPKSISYLPSPTRNLEPNTTHLISILHKSKQCKSLSLAKIAHASILRSGFESNLFVSNNLLHGYCVCGSVRHAHRLFDRMLERDGVSWNTMMCGFISLDQFEHGFCVFVDMVRVGTRPTQCSFASILVASAEMGCGKSVQQVHCFSLKAGFSSDCCVGNSLLKGYSKLGQVQDLLSVSDEMCGLDEISIEILSKAYSENGLMSDSLGLIRYCCGNGVRMSAFAVSSSISLCTRVGCMDSGTQIHGCSIKVGLDNYVSVVNSLISFYSRAYQLEDAVNLFNWFGIEKRDVVTWNSIIGGFAYNGEGDLGLGLVQRMLSSGITMNESTFLSFLSSCAAINNLRNAKKAHSLVLKMRDDYFNQETANIILTMYCRSNSLEDAADVFESMEVKDIVSFNLMMGLHRKFGNYENCMGIFFQAQSQQTVEVDDLMLSTVVFSCFKLGFSEFGQQVHGLVTKIGFQNASNVKNSILELYSRVGSIDDMERIFSEDCYESRADIFSWNMMLIGYTNRGLFDKSIGIWKQMERLGVDLNEFSCTGLLNACSCFNQKDIGEHIHVRVLKKGLVFDTALMNSLLTMYSNCGMMEKARSVFEEISSPDAISYTAMVSGYSQNGFAEESIKIHVRMNKLGVTPNHMTFASTFMSCGSLSDPKLGSQFHAQVMKINIESDLPVSNSLITMYAKCGDLSKSSKIFKKMVYKDVITWNAMINAFCQHGHGNDAVDLFKKMKYSSVRPNNATFIIILSACSHSGLVSEACYLFKLMYEEHGIVPSEEHYTCLVDILCRAGRIEEAKDLIKGMPSIYSSSSSLVWRTLLSACRVNGDVELGEVVAKRIMEMEPGESSAYVLLSELHSSSGDGEGKAEVRRMMKDRGVKKEVGCSWILG